MNIRKVLISMTLASVACPAAAATVISNPGGPYTFFSGDSFSANGTGSYSLLGDPITFAWDLTGNGLFTDSTSATPTVTLGTTSTIAGASFNLCLKVSDTSGSSNTACTTATSLGERVTAALPEPATWAMMLLGFGAIGATMRRRRTGRIRQFA